MSNELQRLADVLMGSSMLTEHGDDDVSGDDLLAIVNILTTLAQATKYEPERCETQIEGSLGQCEPVVSAEYADFYRNENLRKTLEIEQLKQQLAEAQGRRVCWLVENDPAIGVTMYRAMSQGLSVWTHNPHMAMQFSRREDAEMFAEEDDEAGRIVEHVFVDAVIGQKEQSPSSAPAEPVKTTRFYGVMSEVLPMEVFCVTKRERHKHDTHYIDIAEDGSIVGGKIT